MASDPTLDPIDVAPTSSLVEPIEPPFVAADVRVRSATASDRQSIVELVASAGLVLDGIDDQFPSAFVVAEKGGALVGVAALEAHGTAGLLRSVCVAPSLRRSGVGARLVEHLLATKPASLRDVYLLTTTAAPWFERRGFVPANRAEVPSSLQANAEFAHACPASAICLVKRLPE